MIELKNVSVQFTTSSSKLFHKNIINAVEDVSLTIEKNSIVGLVGESGCGKSTLGRAILKLLPLHTGEIHVNGTDISNLSQKQMLPYRKNLQIIFQDPFSSLNSRMTIYEIITEGLFTHFSVTPEEARKRAIETLEKVSLKADILERYPHEFSGGQRQRIAIARVLILEPEFIVCDEAVSALDVSVQAQILNLLIRLQRDMALSMIFISHDLNVVRFISNTVAVMYLGSIMEMGDTDEVYRRPLHPYTLKLLDAVPIADPLLKRKREPLQGEVPNPADPPKGCPFHPRCRFAGERCRTEKPAPAPLNGRIVACHYPLE